MITAIRSKVALGVVAAFLAGGVAYGQAPLLIRMSFNDEAGSASLTNRGLVSTNATLSGGAAYSTDLPPGRTSGRSIEVFGGDNDRVSLGARPELGGMKSFTFTAWIKPKAFNAGKTYPRIFELAQGTSGDLIFSLDNSGGATTNKLAMYLYPTNLWTNHRFAFNEWKFVAVTCDGTATTNNLKAYVGDGTNLVLDSTHSVPALNVGTGALYIAGNAGTTRNFNGFVDDVRMYGMWQSAGGVLSSQQIYQVMLQDDAAAEDVSWVPEGNLYVAHGPGPANSLIRRYRMTGGAATFVEDLVTGLNYVRGLARATDGNLVVAERDNSRLLKGTNGLAPGSFPVFATGINKPRGVALRPGGSGHMYVAEYEDGEVSWYDTNGTYVSKISGLGANTAFDIEFADENEMYVTGNNLIRRYDWNGSSWDQTWSTNAGGLTVFGVRVVNGHLYVTLNASPARIERRNRSTGAVLASWFGGTTAGAQASLAADTVGNLYITDVLGNAIYAHRLDSNGNLTGFRRLISGTYDQPGSLVVVKDPPKGTIVSIR